MLLVRPLALVLWAGLLWVWSVLAEVHLAEYVFGLGGDVSHVVHAHPYWILWILVASLALVAIWPEIKHLVPELPKSIHERVSNHQNRIISLESNFGSGIVSLKMMESFKAEVKLRAVTSETAISALSESANAMDERISKFATAEDLNRVLAMQGNLASAVTDLQASTGSAISSLQDYHNKAVSERTDAGGRIDALNLRLNAAEDAFHVLPRYISAWADFSEFIEEVRACIETYRRLRNMYGTGAPFVSRPFSGWRITNQTFENVAPCIIDAEKWARALEFHVAHVESFYHIRFAGMSPMTGGHLFTLITTWIVNKNDTAGDKLIELLQQHHADLVALRKDYAASVMVGALTKDSIC